MAKKRPKRKTSAPKIELLFAVVCDAANLDPGTGKATLYGVFDKITCPKLPARAQFHFFAKLRLDIGTHTVALHLIAPDKTEKNLGSLPIEVKEAGSVPFHAVLDTELEQLGEYLLQLRSGSKKIATCQLFVEAKND